ncbi:YegS/Rv2252/BmrU family lipid kinase [Peteryoungia aggregata LMG 23059]|uniref:YegS/Rv2252/BmrU family lipid kinase n=1 Tax=Peteryoungia aggregata LMG 23059 TaxID=1368425 RepID=A0ABU0GC21_9HYPH|nr:YegS/Rv2252/BmrU family lipid kinase [Peteryoungia aggregata]MDQ0422892.1 YegS/Rv2252/BmrU family lipid kinase [Peteryoungia aggregata LMG 23059]
MKIAVVRNPIAGGRTGQRQWAPLLAAFRARFPDMEIHESRSSGDARRLACELAAGPYDLLLVAGGDGTISDVVDGVLTSSRPDMPLAFLPVGTGCDFVRNFALPADPAALADHIANAPLRKIDAGLLIARDGNGSEQRRHFANITSAGISGEIVDAVNAPGRPRILNGPLRFLVHSALAMLRYRPYDFEVLVDGMLVHQGRLALVAIANGGWFGGGMHITPDADISDGMFEVAVMREERVLGLLNLLGRLHSAGHVGHPLLSFHRARRVEVRPRDPARFPIEVDGEAPIRGGFVAEILPGVLTVRT